MNFSEITITPNIEHVTFNHNNGGQNRVEWHFQKDYPPKFLYTLELSLNCKREMKIFRINKNWVFAGIKSSLKEFQCFLQKAGKVWDTRKNGLKRNDKYV